MSSSADTVEEYSVNPTMSANKILKGKNEKNLSDNHDEDELF